MRSVKQLAEDMHVFLDVAPLVVFADGKETPWFCRAFATPTSAHRHHETEVAVA